MTIVSGQGNFTTLEEHDLWLVAISVAAFSTLVLYLFVVATGMGTVFTTDQEQRHQRVKLAAAAFYFPGFLRHSFRNAHDGCYLHEHSRQPPHEFKHSLL